MSEIEWVVLSFNGVEHVVPYSGDEMAGYHDPNMACPCEPNIDDGVVVHNLVTQ